jgi:fructosamine-3-kinase
VNAPEAAARALGRGLADARRVAGGDINDAWRVTLDDGTRAFVKARAGARPGEYATEAAALAWLADGGAHVPAVRAAGDGFLALEWLDQGRLDAAGEEALGRELAALHRAGAPCFGAPPPGAPFAGLRLGDVELPPATGDDWPAFYAEHRLAPLLRAATARGALPAGGAGAVEAVIARLPALAGPPEPPARLHGDLWAGNVLPGRDARPRLIDPAADGGHREIDLAMLELFGAPSPRTLAAYDEVYPRAPGHAARTPLWQLLPLLVHAVLFGGGYGASAVAAARRAAAP